MTLLADLNARYTASAFRLELLQHYAGGSGDDVRTIHTDPYLRRVAEHTLAGKHRDRVHVVTWPLSEYVRYELDTYRANVVVGERVMIASSGAATSSLGPVDFWLFDEDTEHPEAVVMHYDDAGSVTELEHVTAAERIGELREQARTARSCAVDLHDYVVSVASPGDHRAG